MKYMSKTVLAGLAVVCLLLGGAPLAQAQTQAQASPPTADHSAAVAALQAQNAAAVAVAVGAQPVAADQLALGARFVKAMNLRPGLEGVFSAALEPTRTQILQAVASQPAEQKAKFMGVVDEALAGVSHDVTDKLIDAMARYYAARLSTAQLSEVLAFYESPIGQKSVLAPQSITEAEKQEMGLYVMNHPAFFEVMGAMVGGMDVSQAVMAREKAGLGDRFKTRMCVGLRTKGMTSRACPAA